MPKLTIPNLLTIFRILLIPFLVIVFYLPIKYSYSISACIFALAAFTDWLDGFLARKLGQYSSFGEFLDPVADKLIVATALALLVQDHSSIFLTVPAIIIIGREIAISALREWMAEIGKKTHVAVSYVGKVKTVIQMIAVTALLSQQPIFANPITIIGYLALYAAAILTIWSMVMYLQAAKEDLIGA